jgi:anti-anti-sigma factor
MGLTKSGVVAIAKSESGSTVVWLRGDHDVFTVPVLSQTISDAMARDHANVVVDLSGVEFMDVLTVSVLARARTVLQRQSRSLTLRSPSGQARRILGLCGLQTAVTGAVDELQDLRRR